MSTETKTQSKLALTCAFDAVKRAERLILDAILDTLRDDMTYPDGESRWDATIDHAKEARAGINDALNALQILADYDTAAPF